MSSEKSNNEKIVNAYTKTNYRVVGAHKHSAVKPCHWQIERLSTGRPNRNCYKGYFGVQSHLCVQNTPALPFCNHQCVFCWRDVEHGSLGSSWQGEVDDPKTIADEMIRHSQNIIHHHITKIKCLENLELARKVLYQFIDQQKTPGNQESVLISESQMAKLVNSTINKTHRAMLLLKNTHVLINPQESTYQIDPRLKNELKSHADADNIIARDVSTPEDIAQGFEEAKHPRHAAISLAGEPTLYPRLGELVQEFRKRNMSTFIVTNGTHPEVIQQLKKSNNLPTQLYMTLPAPNVTEYLKICRPMEPNTWERIMKTVKLLPSLPCRTVIRITAVKFLNIDPQYAKEYHEIFQRGLPNFIDIKGFTVEANALEMQKRFKGPHELREYIPSFDDLMLFAQALEKAGNYEIIATHELSRDILLRGSWPKDRAIEIDYDHV